MRFRLLTGAGLTMLALALHTPAHACDDRISGDRTAGTPCRQAAPPAEAAPQTAAPAQAATPQQAAAQRRADRRARREARRQARRAARVASRASAGALPRSSRHSRRSSRSVTRAADGERSTRGRRSSRRHRVAQRAAEPAETENEAQADNEETNLVTGAPQAAAEPVHAAVLPDRKVATIPYPNPAFANAAVSSAAATSGAPAGMQPTGNPAVAATAAPLAPRPFDAGTNVGQTSDQPSEAGVWPVLNETEKVENNSKPDTTLLRLAFLAFAGLLTIATAARMIMR